MKLLCIIYIIFNTFYILIDELKVYIILIDMEIGFMYFLQFYGYYVCLSSSYLIDNFGGKRSYYLDR